MGTAGEYAWNAQGTQFVLHFRWCNPSSYSSLHFIYFLMKQKDMGPINEKKKTTMKERMKGKNFTI